MSATPPPVTPARKRSMAASSDSEDDAPIPMYPAPSRMRLSVVPPGDDLRAQLRAVKDELSAAKDELREASNVRAQRDEYERLLSNVLKAAVDVQCDLRRTRDDLSDEKATNERLSTALASMFTTRLEERGILCGGNCGCDPVSSPLLGLSNCRHYVCINFVQKSIMAMRTKVDVDTEAMSLLIVCPQCRSKGAPKVRQDLLPITAENLYDPDAVHPESDVELASVERMTASIQAVCTSSLASERLKLAIEPSARAIGLPSSVRAFLRIRSPVAPPGTDGPSF